MLVFLGGCASLWSSGGPAEARSAEIVAGGSSLTGNYLAAEHARSANAEGTEATFLLGALRKAPGDPILLGRAFRALMLGGKPGTGIEIARRYVEQDETATLAQLAIAVGDFHDGRYQRAIDRLQTITKPPFAAAIVPTLKAWSLYAQGNKEAALAEIAPTEARKSEIMLQAHSAWMRDLMADPAAGATFADAVAKAEKDPWLRLTRLLGAVYERAGRYDDARAVYQRFLDKRPDSRVLDSTKARLDRGTPPSRLIRSANDGMAEALFDAAGILARQNQRDTAVMLANLALYLRPDFPELQIMTADLLEGFGRYADANRIYDSIDKRSPLAWSARLSKAQNLNRLDRFDDARNVLRKLAVERPEDPEPLIQLGDIFRQRERYAEAVTVYDEAVARIGTPQKRYWR
jgi:tetratricopeptide (TPR) repeat protein